MGKSWKGSNLLKKPTGNPEFKSIRLASVVTLMKIIGELGERQELAIPSQACG